MDFTSAIIIWFSASNMATIVLRRLLPVFKKLELLSCLEICQVTPLCAFIEQFWHSAYAKCTPIIGILLSHALSVFVVKEFAQFS